MGTVIPPSPEGANLPPGINVGPRPPSPDDWRNVLMMFVLLLGHIIQQRASEFHFERWGGIGTHAADVFADRIQHVTPVFPEDTAERESVALLFEEIQFFIWRYRDAAPSDGVVASYVQETLIPVWGAAAGGNAVSPKVASDAETVFGSIEKFLGWVPRPLRWLLEAMLEALKLTHGG